jgi:hypothetical protein
MLVLVVVVLVLVLEGAVVLASHLNRAIFAGMLMPEIVT